MLLFQLTHKHCNISIWSLSLPHVSCNCCFVTWFRMTQKCAVSLVVRLFSLQLFLQSSCFGRTSSISVLLSLLCLKLCFHAMCCHPVPAFGMQSVTFLPISFRLHFLLPPVAGITDVSDNDTASTVTARLLAHATIFNERYALPVGWHVSWFCKFNI